MKTIAIPRPEDPGGQALWDEAKRAVLERCICGKRIDCACRARLPSVDASVEDEGDE